MKPSRDLCIMACVFCRDEQFLTWLGLHKSAHSADHAKDFILKTCQIKSRNDLDRVPAAAELFHKHIREPFLAWKEAR